MHRPASVGSFVCVLRSSTMSSILENVSDSVKGQYPLWIWGPIAVAGFFILKWLTRPESFKGVPEPPCSSQLWGHFKDAHLVPAGVHWSKLFDEYGPSVKLRAPLYTGKILLTADPGTIHHILTTNCYNYTKSTFTRPFVKRTVGEGLVYVEGEQHKTQRKQLVPVFSQEAVNAMGPMMREVIEHCVNKFSQLMDEGDGVIDVHDIISKTTLDVFGRVALNMDFGCLEGGSQELRDNWRNFGNEVIKPDGFKMAARLRAFPWIAHLPLPSIQAQGDIKGAVEPLATEVIESAKRNANTSSIKGKDLLSTLLRSGEMTGHYLRDNISTLIFAGFDSTSATTTWCLYALARDQRIQNKLREELLSFNGEPTEKDWASMTAFPYFDAVIKEAIRIYAVSDPERVALEDDVVPLKFPITQPDGTVLKEVHVRKGDTIVIAFIGSNTLNRVWGDGKAFRPERWLDEKTLPSKDVLTQGWANLLTFSAGPRMCIGLRLAHLELKILLYSLLRNYVFSLPRDDFVADGYLFASLIPVVRGEESQGGRMPLKITPYLG
ncbi:hypothetical protein QCA50_013220 [Cerrena zonata]|uniref:Cytochrome P450 n=1 Tax=Cerrena zonata TaxID=2478898 RepID=A0AAW0FQ88_9APHY